MVGEVRLWYESLRPKMIDWQGLKDGFRQQYSKIGYTCEDSVRIIHKIIERDLKTILGMTIEEAIIENKDIDIEVEVETIA